MQERVRGFQEFSARHVLHFMPVCDSKQLIALLYRPVELLVLRTWATPCDQFSQASQTRSTSCIDNNLPRYLRGTRSSQIQVYQLLPGMPCLTELDAIGPPTISQTV